MTDPTTDHAAPIREALEYARKGWQTAPPIYKRALDALVSLTAELDEARKGRTAAQDSCNFQEAARVRAETALREAQKVLRERGSWAGGVAAIDTIDRALAVSSASDAETIRCPCEDCQETDPAGEETSSGFSASSIPVEASGVSKFGPPNPAAVPSGPARPRDRLDQIRGELSDLAADQPQEIRDLLGKARDAIAMAQDTIEAGGSGE